MGDRSAQGVIRGSAVGVLVACFIPAFPASAADRQVVATPDDRFDPAEVTIAVGQSVEWRNDGGVHNVVFDDGSFTQPPTPSPLAWRVQRSFGSSGEFRYYCEEHGDRGGVGMSGRVTVTGGGAPDTQAPDVTGFAARRADERVIQIVIRTSEGGTATLRLSRLVRGRYRRVRTLEREVDAGRNAFKVRRTSRGRRLRFGRYKASVRVRDAAGNLSARESDPARLPRP